MDSPGNAPADGSRLCALRLGALAVISAVAGLLLVPAAAAFSQPVRTAVVTLLHVSFFAAPSSKMSTAAAAALISVPVAAAALAIFLAAWRLRLHSWPAIAACSAALAAVLAYLAADDAALRHPLTMETLSPAFPGAQESFTVLMRYGLHTPLGSSFKSPSFKGRYPDWRDIKSIAACRPEIEEHWRELAPMRAWWAELNAFDRIGDLTEVDGDLVSFQALRTVTQYGTAIARLQALDGHGDEAVDTLLPIIEVGQKLQPSARTLVRAMMGVVVERWGLDAAAYVLRTTPESKGARERLASVLRGADPQAGVRHLVAIPYAYSVDSFSRPAGAVIASESMDPQPAWMRSLLNAAGPFIYNPRATLNIYGDFVADLQDYAGRREFAKVAPRAQRFAAEDARPRFKNMLGTMMLVNATPAIGKVAENFWKANDDRVALLSSLGAY